LGCGLVRWLLFCSLRPLIFLLPRFRQNQLSTGNISALFPFRGPKKKKTPTLGCTPRVPFPDRVPLYFFSWTDPPPLQTLHQVWSRAGPLRIFFPLVVKSIRFSPTFFTSCTSSDIKAFVGTVRGWVHIHKALQAPERPVHLAVFEFSYPSLR